VFTTYQNKKAISLILTWLIITFWANIALAQFGVKAELVHRDYYQNIEIFDLFSGMKSIGCRTVSVIPASVFRSGHIALIFPEILYFKGKLVNIG